MTGSDPKGSGLGVVYVIALAMDKDPSIEDYKCTKVSKCCWVTLIAIASHSSDRVGNMKAALKIVD